MGKENFENYELPKTELSSEYEDINITEEQEAAERGFSIKSMKKVIDELDSGSNNQKEIEKDNAQFVNNLPIEEVDRLNKELDGIKERQDGIKKGQEGLPISERNDTQNGEFSY